MADEVLAIAVTLVHTIGDGRQISFQTAFAADMSREGKNALLDDLAALGERQKVKAERPDVVKDLLKHRETLAQFQEDMSRLEAEFPAKKAELEKALADLQDERSHLAATNAFLDELAPGLITLRERRDAEYNAGAEEWGRTQRGGVYKPRGNRAANLEKMDRGIEQAEEAIKGALVEFETTHQRAIEEAARAVGAAESERDVALQQLSISEKRYQQAIAALETRLADIDKILEG